MNLELDPNLELTLQPPVSKGQTLIGLEPEMEWALNLGKKVQPKWDLELAPHPPN